MRSRDQPAANRPVIGWREWVALPQLGIAAIKPKVDTGARSSSLHAFCVEEFSRNGVTYVRFRVHPIQRDSSLTILAEAEVLEYRNVTSSSGERSVRPVIVTDIEALGQRWPIELTLANRDQMGFRMLLGREAIRGRFLVDAGRSFYGDLLRDGRRRKPPAAKKKRKKKRKTNGGRRAGVRLGDDGETGR